jgi:hypothetical protein
MRSVIWLAVVLLGTAGAETTNTNVVAKAAIKLTPKPALDKGVPQQLPPAGNGKPAAVMTRSNAAPVKPLPSKVRHFS